MLAELINAWSYFFTKFDMELETRPSYQGSLGEPAEQTLWI